MTGKQCSRGSEVIDSKKLVGFYKKMSLAEDSKAGMTIDEMFAPTTEFEKWPISSSHR